MPQILLYFLALISLSTAPNWAKLNEMPAEVLGFWRLAIASTLVLSYLFLYKKQKVPLNRQLQWVLGTGFFFFLHLWTYKWASKHTLVSNTMILFATNPIWSSLGGVLFFKEPIKKSMIAAYLIAFFGISLLVYDKIEINNPHSAGNWIALTSAFFYACYMLFSKKARQFYDNTIVAGFQYLIAGLFFAAAVVYGGIALFSENYHSISWLAVLGLVLLPTFLGHMSLTYLVKKMNIGVLTCGKLIEPVLASIFAYFIFREDLSPMAYWAFAMTAVAVIILFWSDIRNYFANKKS